MSLWRPSPPPRSGQESQLATTINYYSDSLIIVISVQHVVFVKYADDLVLVSHSVCVLQKMIDICVDGLYCTGLSFNVKKSCLLRFGSRYMRVCEPITAPRPLSSRS